MELFFGDLHSKILDRCSLIKRIMENPMKLHKIKKNQMQNAIQQDMEEEFMDEEAEMRAEQPTPSMSTGLAVLADRFPSRIG